MRIHRNYGLIMLIPILVMTLAGCQRNTTLETPPTDNSAATNVTAQEVKQQMGEALQTTRAYVAQNKDRYIAEITQKLHDLDQKITHMSNQVEHASGEQKANENRALNTWQEKRAALEQHLAELKASGEESWQKAQTGLNTAMAELENAYKEVRTNWSK